MEKEKEENIWGKENVFLMEKKNGLGNNLHILHILHNQTPVVIPFPKTFKVIGLLIALVSVFVFIFVFVFVFVFVFS